MIKAIVISTFVHGASTYRPGDQADFSPPVFASLAGYGLVGEAPAPHAEQTAPAQRTHRAARTPSNKKAPEPDNKKAPEPDNKASGDDANAQASRDTGTSHGNDADGDGTNEPAVAQDPGHAADA